MRAEFGRIEPNAGNPLLHETGILPGGKSARSVAATSKQKLTRLSSSQPQVFVDGHPGLVCQFEPHRSAGLLLADGCAIHRISARCHVIYADGDDIATAQLAIDGEVEQGEVTLAPSICNLVLIDQTWLGRSGGFAPISLSLFQGVRDVGVSTVHACSLFHSLSPC